MRAIYKDKLGYRFIYIGLPKFALIVKILFIKYGINLC